MVDYVDALRYARERNIILADEFYSLDLNTRQYAGTVSRLAAVEQIKTVLDLVNKSLEDGSTFQDFKKQVEAEGIELSEHHLANVYRTNMQNAYAHGRWQQQQSNKESRSYLKYTAINDSRTRPAHLALDAVIRHIDDPFWQTHYPPNGYQCRCSVLAITEKQALRSGITADDQLPTNVVDNGWSFSPATYSRNLNQVLDQKIDDNILDATQTAELFDMKETAVVHQQANDSIHEALNPLTNTNRKILDDLFEDVASKGRDITPSHGRFVVELSTEDERLTDLLKESVVKKDQDRKSKSIFDWMNDSFNSMLNFAKNLKSKLTGNNLKGFDALNLQKGNVIGIQTPTLFKTAESAGKNITILDMKGKAIDLGKINGLDGALLAPNLNLEVVSVTDTDVVLKYTDDVARRLFVANSTLFSLY